jgi:hypothetical protein
MKKIMFNDRYGLTEAVLSGRKTQTRRIVPRSFFTCMHDILDNNTLVFEDMYGDWHDIRKSAYALKVSEVVAVAQSYKNVGYDPEAPLMEANGIGGYVKTKFSPGWTNKMFIRADLMPHHIRITNVRVERLQDISDSDIKAEGIDYVNGYSESYFFGFGVKTDKGWIKLGNTPREAYAALIDRISGKGTWESNPYVFVYDFELVD